MLKFYVLICLLLCVRQNLAEVAAIEKNENLISENGLKNTNILSDKVQGPVHYQPEQVHLAYGETVRDIVVTWSTWNETEYSIVEYGQNKLELCQLAEARHRKFVDGGDAKKTQYIHRVTLTELEPNSIYFYRCGSEKDVWSTVYSFHTPPHDEDWQPRLAIYGDLGVENGVILPRLTKEVQANMYDAVLHIGDFAYDMHNENGERGDEFMRQIEPVAAKVPYMVCVGNHEATYNFSHYRERFSMPGNTESLFYSFNMGPVHFVGISTEVYYFIDKIGFQAIPYQYDWLKNDLINANLPENRAKHPWIIVFGHRPMYCSSDNRDDCSKRDCKARVGLPYIQSFGLEKLFYDYGVDVEMWGHEHCYERFWPMYDFKVLNGSLEEPYRNPRAPVHIITGAAGNKEGREPFFKAMPERSAFHSQDFGYTRMKAYNKTHLHFEQVSEDKNGAIIDSFWLQKDKHGPYAEQDYEC